jgi:transposase
MSFPKRVAGVDVSAQEVAVYGRLQGTRRTVEFRVPNDSTGHRELISRLCTRARSVRIVLEATGIYHLDLALALHEAPDIEVMVVNPKILRRFAEATSRRAKTDPVDAEVACQFAERMEFTAWTPPEEELWQLRALARRIDALMDLRVQEKNRLHAVHATQRRSLGVEADLESHIHDLDQRIAALRNEATEAIARNAGLRRKLELLLSVRGIALASAIRILGELCMLPGDMGVRQWVAHAGLDPQVWQSGSSVHGSRRISRNGNKRLRQALYMPALVASRWEPAVQAFYDHLIEQDKKPLQALVAIMRKLLHAIYGMFRTDSTFDGARFYPAAQRA